MPMILSLWNDSMDSMHLTVPYSERHDIHISLL
jgi:hypothetical protein